MKKLQQHALALAEAFPSLALKYRFDRANLPVFIDTKDGIHGKNNPLFGASVIVAFGEIA